MKNYAERIFDTADEEVISGEPASIWADNNANGIVGDQGTNAPNINYLNQSVEPQPRQWINPVEGTYWGVVVEYIGSRPIGR